MPFTIYTDIESLTKKQITVKIIQKNLQQQKQENSMSTIWAFENKYSLY